MRRAWRGLAALAMVVAAVSMLMSAWLFKLNADRVDQINRERSANVLRTCADVNERHDAALIALGRVLDRAREGAGPERLRQIEQSRQSTTLLVNALVPRRDCEALAERQVEIP